MNWLQTIFGSNMAIIGNGDFDMQFNAHYAAKTIVGIDETFINKQMIVEKIKALVTQKEIAINIKGKSIFTIPNHIHLITATNNVMNFINIEEAENRYFVIEVPKIQTEDPELPQKIANEIPAFLYLLQNRKLHYKRSTRFWFPYKSYETEALQRIKNYSKSELQMILEEHFEDMFVASGEKELFFTINDLKDYVLNDYRYSFKHILRIVEDKFQCQKYTFSNGRPRYKRYTFYYHSAGGSIAQIQRRALCYTIRPENIGKTLDDILMQIENSDIPF
jgi:hypothetical protein